MSKVIELGSKTKIKSSKASNLNYLYNNFRIAKGFVISSEEINHFLQYNNVVEFKKNNMNYIKSNLKDINNQILNGFFPLPLKNKILYYYKKLNLNEVIVRSSCSLEDQKNFSFAGQFQSLLSIKRNNLLESIKKCVVSLYQSNVISYIENKHIKIDNIYFEILIQDMIRSELSGVAFSKNPVNNNDEIVIEISKQDCHKIVSGNVIPQTYYIKRIKDCENNEQLKKVRDLLINLKKIFCVNVEIEFGFSKNKLYLFQVRPITKLYFSFVNYIENESWCNFKNNNRTLFSRTLWVKGAYKYKHYSILNNITEDIVIYEPNNVNQQRVFNANQIPINEESLKNLDERDLIAFIKEYKIYEKEIERISSKIKNFIKINDFTNFNRYLKILLEKNFIINSYEYLIGSLSQEKYQILQKSTIEKVSKWRNNPKNGDFKIYNIIFKYVINYFSLAIEKNILEKYITCDELLALCDKNINSETLLNRIRSRKEKGFVLLNLRNPKYNNKIIINSQEVLRIKKVVEKEKNSYLNSSLKGIKGKSTFKNGKTVKGEAVVIKDNRKKLSDYLLKNKIVVLQVTTASDVKYLKNVKALIVDNGGILCHSAIFSREFNIPCLMGCEVATKYFNTGDIISFDIDKEYAYKE